ncbi:jg15825 [Pararge aegeria aegeria]|uniref:Jg15825 protein n=1 Tax=Pararge aegeria aegeria TaxID=348720 RepID=A0A8S4SPG6_9NEOP|nr:jg15825 [Pararge aegeria aegeria]
MRKSVEELKLSTWLARVAKLKWQWVTLFGEPMDIAVPRCWSGNPALVNAVWVDLQTGGQTTSSDSQGVAGYKRPQIVGFGTPYKSPMSSSGRQSAVLMMMMNSKQST